MGSEWIKHDGGPCPEEVLDAAREGRSIELQFYEAEGETTKDPKAYCWAHGQSRWDLVAYRIEVAVEPKQEPQPVRPLGPIPDGWRALEPEDMVERFDVIWDAEKRKGASVSMWGYPFKNDNGTGLVIIRQLPNGYHRGCGSVDVGVDR